MITLQQLLSSDTDLTGGALGGKAADGGQDFLALLAGALTDAKAQGKETPLTLSDLQAAGDKLSKAALLKGDESLDASALSDLLASKESKFADDSVQQGTLQGLVSGLMPAGKTDVLKTLTQAVKEADSKSELSDEELAGLSALMAMLPHQQQASTIAAPKAVSSDAIAVQVPLTGASAGRQPALETDAQRTGKQVAQDPTVALPGNNQLSPAVAAVATKHEVDSTPSPTVSGTPTASIAPVLNTANAAQPTLVAAPVVSAPLGSHDWRQSVSQHITLFTKEGLQSAELRLHPENLGQVQISLKLDDNQAQLQMVSAHSHVRAALEAAIPVLRTNLAESGIQLTQSSVSSESFAGQQNASSQQQGQASRSGHQGGFNEESDEILPTPAALQSAARGNGAVDIFA